MKPISRCMLQFQAGNFEACPIMLVIGLGLELKYKHKKVKLFTMYGSNVAFAYTEDVWKSTKFNCKQEPRKIILVRRARVDFLLKQDRKTMTQRKHKIY